MVWPTTKRKSPAAMLWASRPGVNTRSLLCDEPADDCPLHFARGTEHHEIGACAGGNYADVAKPQHTRRVHGGKPHRVLQLEFGELGHVTHGAVEREDA